MIHPVDGERLERDRDIVLYCEDDLFALRNSDRGRCKVETVGRGNDAPGWRDGRSGRQISLGLVPDLLNPLSDITARALLFKGVYQLWQLAKGLRLSLGNTPKICRILPWCSVVKEARADLNAFIRFTLQETILHLNDRSHLDRPFGYRD